MSSSASSISGRTIGSTSFCRGRGPLPASKSPALPEYPRSPLAAAPKSRLRRKGLQTPLTVDLPSFNKRLYRKRNIVERFFNKLKHFRAIATRYDKRDDNYLASIKLASARI